MFRVGISGALAAVLDVLVLIGLVELARVHVTAAAFAGAMSGAAFNFAVNKYWAFADDSGIELRQVAGFAIVAAVSACFIAAAVHLLAVMIGLPYLMAKAIAAAAVFLGWSYPVQARFVFPATNPAHARRRS